MVEAVVSAWSFAESHGWLAAFGLLCLVGGIYYLGKEMWLKLRRYDVALEKFDVHHDSILHLPAGAERPTARTREEVYQGIKDIAKVVDSRMCTAACPVFPRIVEHLERNNKQIEDFMKSEADARKEMFRIVEENYKRNDVFMNSTIAKFVVALEHMATGDKGKSEAP
jgi:hypothetical protein